MRPRDFALMVLICLCWALNNVASKLVVAAWQVPPIFFAALRFAIVLIATLPWLTPVPRPVPRILLIGLLMGALNFGLLFVGLRTTSPSVASIVVQSAVPFTTLLSILMLGEKVHWQRGTGSVLAMAGILVVLWQPGRFDLSWGVLAILAGSLGSAFGSVLMKQIENVEPLRFQAWLALSSLPPLILATRVFETGQWPAAFAAGWPFLGALLFAALVVSVFAQTAFFGLIRRYEANMLAPLTLMNPLFTFGLAAMLTGDRFTAPMIAGSALALLGVLMVVRRPRATTRLIIEREQA